MNIENSTRGYLTAFFRQKNIFLTVFILIMAAGLSYLVITKPVYESSGSIIVKFGQDAPSSPGTSDQRIASFGETDANARQEIIQSYIKIMFSRDMLRGLVKDFGAERLYPAMADDPEVGDDLEEIVVNTLLDGDLRVSNDKSHIIDIVVRNQDPLIAKAFAARVMKAFSRRQSEIYNKPQTDFLNEQVAEAREKYDGSMEKLQAFKQETGISDIDGELGQLLREKSELRTVAFSAITESQARLSELETREAEMRSTYRDDSPVLTRFQNMVAVARNDLQKLKDDLNGRNSSGSSLAARMADVDKRIAFLETKRGKFEDLQQQATLDEDNYLFYVKRGEEARINKLLNRHNITRIAVMDYPAAPLKPVTPKKKLFLAVTLMAAMMGATGTALSRELMDDRLSNPDQVRDSLGIPVFASFEKGAVT